MKSGQSILDLLNLIAPMDIKPPISNSEAQLLYSVWKSGERDNFGRIVLSSPTDDLESLKSKKIIQISPVLKGVAINITAKGRELIKKIILSGEKSALESQQEIDFDKIFRHSEINTKNKKVACLLDYRKGNWLKRICC